MHKDTTIPAAEPFTEEQIQRWRRLQREKAEREYISDMEEARREGLREGFEKGINEAIKKGINEAIKKGINEAIKKGIKLGIMQVAANMLAVGMDIRQVASITELSEAELDALKRGV